MIGRSLTDHGRQLLLAAGTATGVTLGSTALAGLLIGVIAGSGSLAAMRVAAALLLMAAPALGAFVGARRAVGVLGHGLPAAAVGLSGAMVVVVVVAAAALFADDSSIVYTILLPVLGSAAGGFSGGTIGETIRGRIRGATARHRRI